MGGDLSLWGRPATSRRVDPGAWDKIQQGRYTVQQRLDGAGTREVEEDTVFVLFDLRRDFEEGQDHGRRLGVGQRGLLERLGAQGMMQDIRGTRQEEPHGVRQEGRGGRAVAVEVTLDGLAGSRPPPRAQHVVRWPAPPASPGTAHPTVPRTRRRDAEAPLEGSRAPIAR